MFFSFLPPTKTDIQISRPTTVACVLVSAFAVAHIFFWCISTFQNVSPRFVPSRFLHNFFLRRIRIKGKQKQNTNHFSFSLTNRSETNTYKHYVTKKPSQRSELLFRAAIQSKATRSNADGMRQKPTRSNALDAQKPRHTPKNRKDKFPFSIRTVQKRKKKKKPHKKIQDKSISSMSHYNHIAKTNSQKQNQIRIDWKWPQRYFCCCAKSHRRKTTRKYKNFSQQSFANTQETLEHKRFRQIF